MKRPLSHAAGFAAVLLSAGVPALAQDINVMVNGRQVDFTGAQPSQIRGRLLVPLRGVLEEMGATVVWDPDTRTVLGSRGRQQFELPIGRFSARVNGQRVPLDVPAQIMRGTTMVPLRFVSEALGARVRWNDATQTVRIRTDAGILEEEPRMGRDDRGLSDEERQRRREQWRNRHRNQYAPGSDEGTWEDTRR